MKTAVQWLISILEGQKEKPFDYDEWLIALEHAKEMEKKQIIDAYKYGIQDEYVIGAKQYYYETFKQQSVTDDTL